MGIWKIFAVADDQVAGGMPGKHVNLARRALDSGWGWMVPSCVSQAPLPVTSPAVKPCSRNNLTVIASNGRDTSRSNVRSGNAQRLLPEYGPTALSVSVVMLSAMLLSLVTKRRLVLVIRQMGRSTNAFCSARRQDHDHMGPQPADRGPAVERRADHRPVRVGQVEPCPTPVARAGRHRVQLAG